MIEDDRRSQTRSAAGYSQSSAELKHDFENALELLTGARTKKLVKDESLAEHPLMLG